METKDKIRKRSTGTQPVKKKRRLTPEQKRAREKRRRKRRMIRTMKRVGLCVLIAAALIAVLFFGFQLIKGALGDKLPTFGETKQKVVVDAGHGGGDVGTSEGDVLEKDINLALAKKVEKLLKKEGYDVLMIRSKDQNMQKEVRASYANDEKADAYISIHCNYLEEGEASGIETYYDESKDDSRRLAEAIQSAIVASSGAEDRGARTESFAVITQTNMASALVEVGFLSDDAERALLVTDDYQDKLAEGMVQGVISYLESAQSETDTPAADDNNGETEPEDTGDGAADEGTDSSGETDTPADGEADSNYDEG